MSVRVLFVDACTGSWSGPACEAARREAPGAAEWSCATLSPPRPGGAPIPGEPACPFVDDLPSREFDVVVLIAAPGGDAATGLPALPGPPAVIRWPPPDGPGGAEDLVRRVRALASDGCLPALAGQRSVDSLILDSVNDGILAHDLQRRIVFFNRAAERLTGIPRDWAIDRDCHEVFGRPFCSQRCLVDADPAVQSFDERRQRSVFVTPDGERRVFDTRYLPLVDHATRRRVGVVVTFSDQTRVEQLESRAGGLQAFAGLVGRDAKMQEVYATIRDVAGTSVPVLVQGESGTGKELVAAAIHGESLRAHRPFVPVNCGALPEGLLESELFGHVRGAFTGAIRDKKGRFELADGGTIFLDEIGDVTPAMQVRLLRVLQDGIVQRVGGETAVHVDVRVIAASNRDLRKEIEAGRFREDLYYRLNVVPIWLPPLRERVADIPLLVDHLLERFQSQMGRTARVRVSAAALDAMLAHPWPGNVRELQNWLQFALVKCHGDEILPSHLPPQPGAPPVQAPATETPSTTAAPRRRQSLTPERVHAALAQAGQNRREAAAALGVSRATLYRFFETHPDPAWSDAAGSPP